MKTVTLTPDFIEFRSNKKKMKFGISHEKAIELLIKWSIPMHSFCNFDSLEKDDRDWIISECKRVIGDRNKDNQRLLEELI